MPFDQHQYRPDYLPAASMMEAAAAIEAAGFDACNVTDHPFPTADWLNGGGHHTLDPLVALSFAAAATTKLLLHTHCYIPAYRDPFVSAKAVASLDAISGGRVILGVAVGYLEAEFDAVRVPFHRRGRLLDDAVADMIKAWNSEELWGEEPDRVFRGNQVVPKPSVLPHPPIWVGGNSEAALRRAVAWGDGWVPFPARNRFAAAVRTVDMSSIDTLRTAIARAGEMSAEAGRTQPLDVCFTPFSYPHNRETFDVDKFVDEALELKGAGVTWLAFHLPSPSQSAFLDNVAGFGTDALPKVR
jgi:probable F420-dependent oxidoreductase